MEAIVGHDYIKTNFYLINILIHTSLIFSIKLLLALFLILHLTTLTTIIRFISVLYFLLYTLVYVSNSRNQESHNTRSTQDLV